MKTILVLAVILLSSLIFVPGASAQAPAIFYTDLQSAVNSGNSDTTYSSGNGAYVTIYGNNFGATQGTSTVTWNGQNCLLVVSWSSPWLWYQKMVVQVGSTCTPGTGNLVVTTSAGSSNGLALAVRSIGSNHIWYVKSNGNNGNAGTFSSPFQTMTQCAHGPTGGSQGPAGVMAPGDVCYVLAGVNQAPLDSYGSLDLCVPATAALPSALIAYPGTAKSDTIGSDSRDKGLYINGGLSACSNGTYWTVSGFILRANTINEVYTPHNRIIANYITCPAANGVSEGCLEPATGGYASVLGNEITNLGHGGKLFHAIYFGADSHDYEAGWNQIHDIIGGCRAIQVFNGSTDSYNVSIHDNLIYNVSCDGINLASVNPNNGFVKVYNNVVYNAGAGPDLGGQNATCLNINSTGANPTSPALVYNNTFYNCGALGNSDSAMVSPYIPSTFDNNIIVASGSEKYFTSGSGSSNITGSNNIWFGAGNGPSSTSGNLNVNPGFVATGSTPDLHLSSASSPAQGTGTTAIMTQADHDGVLRALPPAIGAYQFFTGGTTAQKPNPPTNLQVTIQ